MATIAALPLRLAGWLLAHLLRVLMELATLIISTVLRHVALVAAVLFAVWSAHVTHSPRAGIGLLAIVGMVWWSRRRRALARRSRALRAAERRMDQRGQQLADAGRRLVETREEHLDEIREQARQRRARRYPEVTPPEPVEIPMPQPVAVGAPGLEAVAQATRKAAAQTLAAPPLEFEPMLPRWLGGRRRRSP